MLYDIDPRISVCSCGDFWISMSMQIYASSPAVQINEFSF